VTFPTSASTEIRDGTLASNQVSLAATAMTITNWPPGAALWLTWQAQTLGSAQNLAIDNLNFAAGTVAAPSVATQPATVVGPIVATLNGSVNPNTLASTAYFEYGTSVSYGAFTATNNLAAGLSSTATSSLASGLQPGTTYHYRAVANNSLGTTTGSDTTFTTTPITPPQLGGVTLGGGGLHFNFTSVTGVSFTVLTTTNVAQPLNQWQVLGSPTEGPVGQYHFSDPQTNQQRYYLLRQP